MTAAGGSPASGIAATGQVGVQFAALKSQMATGRSTAHQRSLGACYPGGAAWTARHGQGFNLGARTGRRDWRSLQLSIRRSFGLVYRLVDPASVMAASESSAGAGTRAGSAGWGNSAGVRGTDRDLGQGAMDRSPRAWYSQHQHVHRSVTRCPTLFSFHGNQTRRRASA